MAVESARYVEVSIDAPGLGNLGLFAVKSGGGLGGESAAYSPGGGLPQKKRGGTQTFEDVTVKREEEGDRDLPLYAALAAYRQKARAMVTDVRLDEDGNPFERSTKHVGLYAGFTPPDADANGNNIAELELTFEIDGFTA